MILRNSTHALVGIHAHQANSSNLLLFKKKKKTNTSRSENMTSSRVNHNSAAFGETTLRCRKQPADSQIRSYRERRCSRKTRGPPPASLLSSQSPSSPRRRSSEGEDVRRRRRRRREEEEEEEKAEKRKVKPELQSSTTNKQTSVC